MGKMETPEALAGATGAGNSELAFNSQEYRFRAERATTLCLAIADTHPEDAAPILEAALLSMNQGSPPPSLVGVMDEAAWWADFATPVEHKAYCLACYRRMPRADQLAFLDYVGRPQ